MNAHIHGAGGSGGWVWIWAIRLPSGSTTGVGGGDPRVSVHNNTCVERTHTCVECVSTHTVVNITYLFFKLAYVCRTACVCVCVCVCVWMGRSMTRMMNTKKKSHMYSTPASSSSSCVSAVDALRGGTQVDRSRPHQARQSGTCVYVRVYVCRQNVQCHHYHHCHHCSSWYA